MPKMKLERKGLVNTRYIYPYWTYPNLFGHYMHFSGKYNNGTFPANYYHRPESAKYSLAKHNRLRYKLGKDDPSINLLTLRNIQRMKRKGKMANIYESNRQGYNADFQSSPVNGAKLNVPNAPEVGAGIIGQKGTPFLGDLINSRFSPLIPQPLPQPGPPNNGPTYSPGINLGRLSVLPQTTVNIQEENKIPEENKKEKKSRRTRLPKLIAPPPASKTSLPNIIKSSFGSPRIDLPLSSMNLPSKIPNIVNPPFITSINPSSNNSRKIVESFFGGNFKVLGSEANQQKYVDELAKKNSHTQNLSSGLDDLFNIKNSWEK